MFRIINPCNSRSMRAFIGEYDLRTEKETKTVVLGVTKGVIHEHFNNTPNFWNDIALLLLEKEVDENGM